jgi:hypothetical protein
MYTTPNRPYNWFIAIYLIYLIIWHFSIVSCFKLFVVAICLGHLVTRSLICIRRWLLFRSSCLHITVSLCVGRPCRSCCWKGKGGRGSDKSSASPIFIRWQERLVLKYLTGLPWEAAVALSVDGREEYQLWRAPGDSETRKIMERTM